MPKITVPVSDLSFTGKAMHFNGFIYKLIVLLTSRKKCIVAMFSCLKKSEQTFYYARFSAMSHVKLIAETKKTYGYFFTLFRTFLRKNKKYFTGNEE